MVYLVEGEDLGGMLGVIVDGNGWLIFTDDNI